MSFEYLLNKVRLLLHRKKFASELEEEMAFHRELKQKDLEAEGMPSAAAQRITNRQFGNPTVHRQRSHEVIAFRAESVWQDLGFALRQLRRNPGFTLTAVLVLALGIGASVAIFSFVEATLLKPLPYREPQRLVGVYEATNVCPRCNFSYLDYLDWKRENTVFRSFEAWGFRPFLLKSSQGVQAVSGIRVTDGFFRTLGVTPMLGRDFYVGENSPSSPRTVLLSYSAWQKHFGGRQDVVGQSVTLSDDSYTIIGVLPAGFHFALDGAAGYWTTLHEPNPCEKRRSCHSLFGIARLKDGVTVEAAFKEMVSIAKQLELQYPSSNRGEGALVLDLAEDIVGKIRPILLLLLSGAGLLLLISCVNVSSLLLVRSESRRREIAVRSSLGASTRRLMSQFVTEGVVLVVMGAMLGLLLAPLAEALLLHLLPKEALESMPYLQQASLNLHVLIFACLVCVLASLLFSLAPALGMRSLNLRRSLSEESRSSSGLLWKRMGSNLVVVELAIAMVLLAGAGLLGKSFYRLLHVDLAFQPDHLAVMDLSAPNLTYGKDEQVVALGKRIEERVRALPGVESVGISTFLPTTCNCHTTWFRVPGHPWNGEHNDAPVRLVSPSYFKTMKVRLLRGRYFEEGDNRSKPDVAIINRKLAEQFFPGEDPIGKQFGNEELSPNSLTEIVGVVENLREGALDEEIRPVIYYDFNQNPDNSFSVAVRTSLPEQSFLPALRSTLRQIDPTLGIDNESSMMQRLQTTQTAYLHRASAWIVGGFACLALALGVIGLYGVIAYSVSQRTREIGVRMALGAQRFSVYSLVLRQASWLTLVGIASGLLCSLLAASLIRKMLFETESWDLSVLLTVALLLAVSSLLASYLPARRAASVNPVEALRAE